MKTEKRRPQKSLCNIRGLLMWLAITIGTTMINAQSAIEPISDNDKLIMDISYEYELIESGHHGLQCYGTLNLSLNITDNIERLILERTTPHEPEDSPPKFLVKRELPVDSHQSLQDFPWRTRFRIQIRYKDGSCDFSDVYNINNYIDEKDLRLLYESSSTASVKDDGIDINLDNGSLNLSIHGKGILEVFESNGSRICSNIINGSETFDIHDINTSKASILILKIRSVEKTIVKKIHIQ